MPVAERTLSRGEILDALESLGLSVSWLATKIGEERQTVHRWLSRETPTEPRDASVWEKMTDVILKMGRPRQAVSPEIRKIGIEIGLAVLEGNEDEAKRLAPLIIRELTKPYDADV